MYTINVPNPEKRAGTNFGVLFCVMTRRDETKQKPIEEKWRRDENDNLICQGKSYADYLRDANIKFERSEGVIELIGTFNP